MFPLQVYLATYVPATNGFKHFFYFTMLLSALLEMTDFIYFYADNEFVMNTANRDPFVENLSIVTQRIP